MTTDVKKFEEYLIDPQILPRIFPGCGKVTFKVNNDNEGIAKILYGNTEIVLAIPKVHDDGSIIHNGIRRIPMYHMIAGTIISPREYISGRLSHAVNDFNISLSQFGYKLLPSSFQSAIDLAINAEPLGYGNRLYRYCMRDRVLVHIEQTSSPEDEYNARVEIQSVRNLCTLSTPMGSKIGLVNFLTDVDEEGNSYRFSKVLRKVPFIEHINVARLPIVCSNLLHSSELIDCDIPLIRVLGSDNIPEPPGLNVRTAFFSMPETFEDTIVISESLAKRLVCIKRKVVTWHDHPSLVKPNDIVTNGQPLCDDDNEPRCLTLYDKNAYAIVDDVRQIERKYMSSIHKTYTVELSVVYHMQDGDKVSNRSGQKGTVKIMPDEWMPKDSRFRRIDAVISPYSIYKGPNSGRRNYGQLIEAILTQINEDQPMMVEQLSGEYGLRSLAQYEDKLPLVYHKDKEIKCINGTVFMMRQDNHAVDSLKCIGNERVITLDSREQTGVRLGLADIHVIDGLYEASPVTEYISKYVTGYSALTEFVKLIPGISI